VTVKGDKLRTPYDDTILPGTTQAALFAHAESQGYRCKQKVVDVDYLLAADSVWLVSSTRVAARVRRLGEDKLKASDNENEIRTLIVAALTRVNRLIPLTRGTPSGIRLRSGAAYQTCMGASHRRLAAHPPSRGCY